MSFNIVCQACGAPSSPSTGVCPFCKTVFSESDGAEPTASTGLIKLYLAGKLEQALPLGLKMLKDKPELKEDLTFLLTLTKVLLESEGPSSQIRNLLAEAQIHFPQNPEVLEYIEVIEAKSYLKRGINDTGETMLKNLIRRAPRNLHAHFLLGTHLFWSENDSHSAIPMLETCVRLHPNFLRAWGCLAAIYQKLGNASLAQAAFAKCAELESNSRMRDFFLQQAKAS